MKNKCGAKISADEEKIKSALRSDIDTAAKRAGNWREISETAYEPHDHVRRSSLPLVFPAVCAVMLAVSLGAMQLFSGTLYDLSRSPRSAAGAQQTTENEDAAADGGTAEDQPYIGEIEAKYSSDENGSPYTGSYSLTVPVFFPHEEGYTDYGSVYVYVICEGETLYGANEFPTSYTTGETKKISVRFKMKDTTADASPQVAVAVCFVRDGGEKSLAAVSSVQLNSNSYYSKESEENAYNITENEYTVSTGYRKEMDRVLEIADLSDVTKSFSYSEDNEGYGIRFCDGGEHYLSGYDIVVMTAGDAYTLDGTRTMDTYCNFGYSEEGSSVYGIYREGYLSLSDVIDDGLEYSDDDCIFAAAIPRGEGEITLSPVYRLSDHKQISGETK